MGGGGRRRTTRFFVLSFFHSFIHSSFLSFLSCPSSVRFVSANGRLTKRRICVTRCLTHSQPQPQPQTAHTNPVTARSRRPGPRTSSNCSYNYDILIIAPFNELICSSSSERSRASGRRASGSGPRRLSNLFTEKVPTFAPAIHVLCCTAGWAGWLLLAGEVARLADRPTDRQPDSPAPYFRCLLLLLLSHVLHTTPESSRFLVASLLACLACLHGAPIHPWLHPCIHNVLLPN